MERSYQICTKCIMDTSDQYISFDEQGTCEYCQNYLSTIEPHWKADVSRPEKLQEMAKKIKAGSTGEFDCIIGLSGGLDSSYAAHVAVVEMGLRPLLFHVDAGWNSDIAVGNIEKLVDGLGLDLYTEVVDWGLVRDFQVAFLKSGIPDQDLVQDAAFFSALYQFARKNKVKHIITGSNFSTECCREPEAWGGYLGIDKRLFLDIWRNFGSERIVDDFPLIDILKYKIWYQYILGFTVHHPLNFTNFIKVNAEQRLNDVYGWVPLKHKHHESRFTRFYEDYWLPRRFGFEKRRAHFSSLIMTGQMTRKEALNKISVPELDEHMLNQEFNYVASKLGLTKSELNELFTMPKKTYCDYKNKRAIINLGSRFLRCFGKEKRLLR